MRAIWSLLKRFRTRQPRVGRPQQGKASGKSMRWPGFRSDSTAAVSNPLQQHLVRTNQLRLIRVAHSTGSSNVFCLSMGASRGAVGLGTLFSVWLKIPLRNNR